MGGKIDTGIKIDNFGGKKVMDDNPYYKEYDSARNKYFSIDEQDKNYDAVRKSYKDIKKKALAWERTHTSFWNSTRLKDKEPKKGSK